LEGGKKIAPAFHQRKGKIPAYMAITQQKSRMKQWLSQGLKQSEMGWIHPFLPYRKTGWSLINHHLNVQSTRHIPGEGRIVSRILLSQDRQNDVKFPLSKK
jgi:hypothetical protein